MYNQGFTVRFGLSTHLYHDKLLGPAHLAEVASHEFMLVEVFATRTHFDYHNPAAIRELGRWLTDAGLFLHSLHAPIVEGYVNGVWGAPFSTAAADPAQRHRAVREAEAALNVAQTVPFEFLVVHVGVPDAMPFASGNNAADAARRTIQELHALASTHHVRLALEVIPNRLSTADTLVRMIDEELELPDVGLCLDYGHAFLMGDLADTIETVSGHLMTTHVHDNNGRDDVHLVPFEGGIDWSTAVMTTQKIGYEGVWLMELAANNRTPAAVLQHARTACRRLEAFTVAQE
jgi:sugar phosphate isomerase/epimerase